MIFFVLLLFLSHNLSVASDNTSGEAHICSRGAYEAASQAFDSDALDTTPIVMHKKIFYLLCTRAAQDPTCKLGQFQELIQDIQPRMGDDENTAIILYNQLVVALRQLLNHVPPNLTTINYEDVLDLGTRKINRTGFLVISDNVDAELRKCHAEVETDYKELCKNEKFAHTKEKRDAVRHDYHILSLSGLLH